PLPSLPPPPFPTRRASELLSAIRAPSPSRGPGSSSPPPSLLAQPPGSTQVGVISLRPCPDLDLNAFREDIEVDCRIEKRRNDYLDRKSTRLNSSHVSISYD